MRVHKTPYQEVIDSFRSLDNYTKPIDKLRAVGQVSRLIVLAINEFWSGIVTIPKDRLQ